MIPPTTPPGPLTPSTPTKVANQPQPKEKPAMTATATPPPPAPQPPTETKKPKSTSLGKIILGVIIGMFLFVGACTAILGTAVNEAAEDFNDEFAPVTVEVTVPPAEGEQPAPTTEAAPEPVGRAEQALQAMELDGCAPGGTGTFIEGTLTFVNPFDEPAGFVTVSIAVQDAEGIQIGTASALFQDVGVGVTARTEWNQLAGDSVGPWTCTIVEVQVL